MKNFNIKKNIIWILLLLVLVIIVLVQTIKRNDKTILIGADITLTGKFGYFGQQLQRGLLLVEQMLSEEEDNTQVKIIIQDNRHITSDAISIFEKFANVDKVSAAISLYSPMSKAINELALQYNIPLITTYTTATDITNAWTFRDFPTMEAQIPILTNYAYEHLGVRSGSCILYQTDFGHDARDIFKNEFTKMGGKYIQSEEIPLEAAENMIRDVVTKILIEKPECIFLVLSANTLGVAVKRLRESNYEGTILSVVMFDSPEVREAAGNAADGVYYSSIPVDFNLNEEAKELKESYISKYGADPDYMVVYGYTIGKYLIKIVREANGDRELVLKKLKTLDINSIRGPIIVEPDNSIISPVAIYKEESSNGILIELKK